MLAEWIASFESQVSASEALDVSKSSAGRLERGEVEPSLRDFLAACVHERDRAGFSALFNALREDFEGEKGGLPLEVERDASRAISDCAEAIGMFNKALANGKIDADEAEQLVDEVAKLQADCLRMQADLRALMSSIRTRA